MNYNISLICKPRDEVYILIDSCDVPRGLYSGSISSIVIDDENLNIEYRVFTDISRTIDNKINFYQHRYETYSTDKEDFGACVFLEDEIEKAREALNSGDKHLIGRAIRFQ